MAKQKIAVIGAGSWGTAISWVLDQNDHEIKIWAREPEIAAGINEEGRNPVYLQEVKLSKNVSSSSDIAEVLRDVNAVIMVTPSIGVRPTAEAMAPYLGNVTPVLILSKGVEEATSYLMTDILEEVFGNPSRIAALSGPNHAEEVSKGIPSATVIAAHDEEVARYFQDVLATSFFRVYTNSDITGVEMCGAGKNVIALACGICDGLGLGDNTKAAVMTRGLAELARLGEAIGANPRTYMGLAGMGDLIVTCTSKHSRNRSCGEFIGKGGTLTEYLAGTNMVVEGAVACRSLRKVAHDKGVSVPITDAVYDVLYGDLKPEDSIDVLMDRPLTKEH